MPAIYLIRHGQASFGAADYDQLSPLGYRQGEALGRTLDAAGLLPAAVVCGRMKRHAQTAEACLGAMKHPAYWQEEAGLDEFDHMEIIGTHRPDLVNHGEMAAFLKSQPHPAAAFEELFQQAMLQWIRGEGDYRESWQAFRQRVTESVHRLAGALNSGESLLIFSSGGPIGVMAQQFLGFPDEDWPAFSRRLVNAGLTRLAGRADNLQLVSLNEHLYLNGELLSYR
jgi:broad specificity phosphatase PhoE